MANHQRCGVLTALNLHRAYMTRSVTKSGIASIVATPGKQRCTQPHAVACQAHYGSGSLLSVAKA
eukprot:6022427-Amphidinium_carterae.1